MKAKIKKGVSPYGGRVFPAKRGRRENEILVDVSASSDAAVGPGWRTYDWRTYYTHEVEIREENEE